MKLLVAASVLDVALPFGCTPAWWQLLKALHEEGTEVVATPYYGQAVDSLWWRSYPNPCESLGAIFNRFRNGARALKRWLPRSTAAPSRKPSRVQGELIKRLITPAWHRHLAGILRKEGDISGVLILNIPLNHLGDVPKRLQDEFQVPICYFDGDLPASLPSFGGFSSGFSIYDGADIAQYDCLFSNSLGSLDRLRELGAKRAEVLWWGADPGVFRPTPQDVDIDVFFYGLGTEFREDWLRDMITLPSQQLPQLRFVVAGDKLDMDLGKAERLGLIAPSQLSHYVSRSKINLNVARRAHASIYASATTRVFELAAMRQCIVSNPLLGLHEWFEDGKELIVVQTSEDACEAYRRLTASGAVRQTMGSAARERILACHTYRHRARELQRVFLELGGDYRSPGTR